MFNVRSCKILAKIAFFARNTTLANFLQEMSNCCKIYFQIHQSCKICIFYKNFAKVILIARILQDFCEICFSCELGYQLEVENRAVLHKNRDTEKLAYKNARCGGWFFSHNEKCAI